MARLNARSVKSRQNRVLRYVVSTDVDKSAVDLGVSTKQLNRFLRAKPETVQKHPEQFSKLLDADTKSVAEKNDVKLVQRLSGKRLAKAYDRRDRDRVNRAVRLAEATRERRRVERQGQVTYVPIKETRITISRNQILSNMSGYSSKSIIEMTKRGELSNSEGKELFRKLWANSGMTRARADAAFEKAMS